MFTLDKQTFHIAVLSNHVLGIKYIPKFYHSKIALWSKNISIFCMSKFTLVVSISIMEYILLSKIFFDQNQIFGFERIMEYLFKKLLREFWTKIIISSLTVPLWYYQIKVSWVNKPKIGPPKKISLLGYAWSCGKKLITKFLTQNFFIVI